MQFHGRTNLEIKDTNMEEKNYTIALLIDTDNVSSKYMRALYDELIALGKITYKRMYGDFTVPNAVGWKKLVNEFAITPVQQYTYTKGKNATDFRIIIDAMDILYTKNVDAFCIMSSDSDYTGLAKRLKESNMFIIGAGESKTPTSFVKSCDRFFRLDKPETATKNETPKKEEPPKKEEAPKREDAVKKDKKIAEHIKPAPVVCEPHPPESDNEEDASVGDASARFNKSDVEKLSIKILENTDGKPYALSALVAKLYQAYPELDFRDFGAKKAQDFFSKEMFVITTGKTTEKYISLK